MQAAVSSPASPALPTTSHLRAWLYTLSLVPGILTIGGNLLGGPWAGANVLFSLVVLALIERVFPQVEDNAPAEAGYRLPEIILGLHVVLPVFTIGTLLWGAYTGALSGWALWAASSSVGVHSGSSGIVIAHELCHRKEVGWRWASRWLLFTALNPYFYIAHVKGHHRLVATADDPASARRGESLYAFIPRSIAGQFRETWQFEVERLRQAGQSPYSLRNYLVGAVAASAVFITGLAIIHPLLALVFIKQGVLACLLLEYTNYIEHYGLSRKVNNGITERIGSAHSWESNHATRFLLVDLTRHPDHHQFGARPYHQLKKHAEAPQLPTGYSGMFWLALVPPLFYAVLHPVIDRYHKEGVGPSVV